MEKYSELKETKAFKYAIASVILAFLTAIFLVLAAIPSVVYAVKALREVRGYPYSIDTRTIKRIAWFGLVLGLNGLVLSIYSIVTIVEMFVL